MGTAAYPGVSIVILTWNGLHLLKQSLDSVVASAKSYHGPSEIIVVDNGSEDRTVDVLADFYPEIRVLALDRNYGFAEGCNRGAQLSRYPYILFLNNDLFVRSDLVSVLMKEIQELQNPFSLSPLTNYWWGRELTDKVFSSAIGGDFSKGFFQQHWAVQNYRTHINGVVPTIYGTGAVLLVDRVKFIRLGGFSGIFSPAYWEDVDLCVHAWKRGWGSYCTSNTLAWHQVSATSSSQGKTWKEILSKRNELIFFLLNSEGVVELFRFLARFVRRWLFGTLLSSADRQVSIDFLSRLFQVLRERRSRKNHQVLRMRQILEITRVDGPKWISPEEKLPGFLDLWRHLFQFRKSVNESVGCVSPDPAVQVVPERSDASAAVIFGHGFYFNQSDDFRRDILEGLEGLVLVTGQLSESQIRALAEGPEKIYYFPNDPAMSLSLQLPRCENWTLVSSRKVSRFSFADEMQAFRDIAESFQHRGLT